MTIALVTFGKSGVRKEFAIEKGTTVIGRRIDADLRIPLNQISRAHCEILVNKEKALLRDLDSSNGTYVNGEQIKEVSLKAGDLIKLGPVIFTVQIDGEPKDITPPAVTPAPKSKPRKASDKSVTTVGAEGLDVDDLDEIDVDDLSDLDMDDIGELEDSDLLEEIDELEELSEDDLINDDETK